MKKVYIKASAEETFSILLYYSPTCVVMVQTMGFGVYTSVSLYVPLFSILSMRVAVLVVFITVYNDPLLPV